MASKERRKERGTGRPTCWGVEHNLRRRVHLLVCGIHVCRMIIGLHKLKNHFFGCACVKMLTFLQGGMCVCVCVPTLSKYYIEEGLSRDPKKWIHNLWTTPYYFLILHFLTSGIQQCLAASIRVQTTRTTPPWLFHNSWSELELARPNN